MAFVQKQLTKLEGMELTAVDAKAEDPDVNDWTVCVGFKLDRPDAETVFSNVLPGVSYHGVYNQSLVLSEKQCLLLLANDLERHFTPKAIEVAGKGFCILPMHLKVAVLMAVRGGDLEYSDATAGHIRSGNWCGAADEYQEHDPYLYCQFLDNPCARMDWCAQQFVSMCRLKKRSKS